MIIRSLTLLLTLPAFIQSQAEVEPYKDRAFGQETAQHFDIDSGLQTGEILSLKLDSHDRPVASLATGSLVYQSDQWVKLDRRPKGTADNPPQPSGKNLSHFATGPRGAQIAAGSDGIFERSPNGEWQRLRVKDGLGRYWGLDDVRAVTYDQTGQLWFGVLAGLAYRDVDSKWHFMEGKDGLPFNEFTCAASGSNGAVWFGTTRGAIRFHEGKWHYRQGKRWLVNDWVTSITIDSDQRAWIGTKSGISCIRFEPMTLAEKAALYEQEVETLIKRTPFGYLAPIRLQSPGDRNEVIRSDNDNDGLWTAMYGAGQCFAFAATQSPEAKVRAQKAFTALSFLQSVTQGGDNSPPPGYVARSIRATSLPDPNQGRVERDREKQKDDQLWKVYEPRWPKSVDGQWYWKSDTSSDELDGHYFFYGLYYDLVAKRKTEKDAVRNVVKSLTDHLIANDFNLTDHDGQPTRWGIFNPRSLNRDENWYVERGLNSLSLLSYLTVAEYVTQDARYSEHIASLREDHAYDANAMVPKTQRGIGSGNQSDDEMAFMGFYSLLRFTKDSDLRSRLLKAFYPYWTLEQPELNPFFNFTYAACALNQFVSDPWGNHSVDPWENWLNESMDTLKAFPLDRANWAHENSHRLDIIRLPKQQAIDIFSSSSRIRGTRVNGKALPVDERHFNHWNTDPFQIDYPGSGNVLACGTVFLLPYYMGLYHGFIQP